MSRSECRNCSQKYYSEAMGFNYFPMVDLKDENNTSVGLHVVAVVRKGIGHENCKTEWINYRRNHIQIDVKVQLDLDIFTNHLFVSIPSMDFHNVNQIPSIEKQQISNVFLKCVVTTAYDRTPRNMERIPPVGMVQTSAKRDSVRPVEPIQLFDFTEGIQSQSSRSLDRLQFSRATIGNDVSNDESQVETFTLEFELLAETTLGETVLLGYAQSFPCVSRGRAPCHFEKRCDLHTNGNCAKKTQRVQKKTYRSITPPISPSLKSIEISTPQISTSCNKFEQNDLFYVPEVDIFASDFMLCNDSMFGFYSPPSPSSEGDINSYMKDVFLQ
jgi:hypothetical protein